MIKNINCIDCCIDREEDEPLPNDMLSWNPVFNGSWTLYLKDIAYGPAYSGAWTERRLLQDQKIRKPPVLK
jgi:hypothetical protein